jgi:hypothetical protein
MHSKHGVGGNMAWFDYRIGKIVIKIPDKDILCKMRNVAMALEARVRGDDGEHYDLTTSPGAEPGGR